MRYKSRKSEHRSLFFSPLPTLWPRQKKAFRSVLLWEIVAISFARLAKYSTNMATSSIPETVRISKFVLICKIKICRKCHKKSHPDSLRVSPMKTTHNLITSIVNHQQSPGSKVSYICMQHHVVL